MKKQKSPRKFRFGAERAENFNQEFPQLWFNLRSSNFRQRWLRRFSVESFNFNPKWQIWTFHWNFIESTITFAMFWWQTIGLLHSQSVFVGNRNKDRDSFTTFDHFSFPLSRPRFCFKPMTRNFFETFAFLRSFEASAERTACERNNNGQMKFVRTTRSETHRGVRQ